MAPPTSPPPEEAASFERDEMEVEHTSAPTGVRCRLPLEDSFCFFRFFFGQYGERRPVIL